MQPQHKTKQKSLQIFLVESTTTKRSRTCSNQSCASCSISLNNISGSCLHNLYTKLYLKFCQNTYLYFLSISTLYLYLSFLPLHTIYSLYIVHILFISPITTTIPTTNIIYHRLNEKVIRPLKRESKPVDRITANL